MSVRVATGGALLAALLAACSSAPLPAGTPAVIVNPDADSRRELQQVVSAALELPSVQLADDALTTTSVLTLEHAAPRGIDAPPATGRQLGRPERFRLLRDGPQCVLVHDRTGMRWLLLDTECTAE
ncbi:MAG: hypothetical protein U5K76_03870 [Woeseiaceae bacterium]|nr:hypothetical protein [Woeseiaceae bacterium]